MSTIAPFPGTASPSHAAATPPLLPFYGDHRTVFRGVSWETYEAFSQAQREGHHVRLAYDGRDLEIMTIGKVHENLRELLVLIIQAVTSWRGIAHVACGEATLNAASSRRGLQADLSYRFEPEKVRIAREALARRSMDPADYPRPDLAIEIDVSPSPVDRPSIYAALNVSEVWRIQRDRKVVIEHLQPDGSYSPTETSRFLGISADEIQSWLTAEDVGQEEVWVRRLIQWAMGLGRPA